MEVQVKDAIMAAAKAYMADYKMTASDFARRADVNKSYLSVALKGAYVYQSTTMPEAFFRKIAAVVNYAIETSYWEHVDTDQYIQVVNTLNEARARVEARMIVGQTGCGKTYAVDRFCAMNPVGVYRITVNDYDTVHDIMTVMYDLLGIDTPPTKRGARLRGVGRELRNRAMAGERPIVIIDEAENTKVPGIKAYKALYDMFAGYVAFVLVCTEELPGKLEKLRHKDGMPQFIRRFKANRVDLVPVAGYDAFLAKVEDPKLRILLSQIADNYGELHDYLERALREAAENGEPLTEDLFREIYNLPKR